jgi:hypothetical protein
MAGENGDIRGADPAMNTKEVLMELRGDFKKFREEDWVEVRDIVKTLAGQNLANRVNDLEAFKDRMMGIAAVGSILGVVATVLSIIAILAGAPTPTN